MSSKSLIFSNQPEKSLAQQILQKNNGKYSIALHRFSTDVYTYKKSDVAVYSHKGTHLNAPVYNWPPCDYQV